MKNKLPTDKGGSMSAQLLRVVFGFYLMIVIGLFFGEMAVDYRHQKKRILAEFLNIQTTFEQVLAGQLWNMDEKALCSTVKGMIELPTIVGMKIYDERGKIIAQGGLVEIGDETEETDVQVYLSGVAPTKPKIGRKGAYRFEMFEGDFPIIYSVNHENRILGRAMLYSNSTIIFNRLTVSFLMSGVKLILEIGLLWLIFNWVFTRVLKRPLAELTSAVKCVTLDNLNSITISTHSGGGNELEVLAAAFNQMLLNLRNEMEKRKIADANLSASKERLSSILKASPAGIGLSKDRIFQEVNPAVCELLGYRREELLGQSSRLLYRSEEEFACVGKKSSALIQQQGMAMMEVVWCRKDGVQLDMLLSIAPLTADPLDPNITFIALDISERKRADAALAAEKERLAVTLRSIGDGVITTDTQGNVVIMNKIAENLTGWLLSEAQGKPLTTIFNIIHEGTRLPCENPAEKVLATRGIIELANHTLLISRDGTERVIADSGAPIMNQTSEIIGVVLVFRDMTEKQRFLDNLQRTDKLDSLGILAGGIAHDFNNMLAGIFGYIDLAREFTTNKMATEYLNKSMAVLDRTKNLTQQLLTFSKGGTPHRETAALDSLVRDCASFALSGSNAACDYVIDNDLWLVDFDKNQIGQVIDNLLINAQQAMPMGGRIIISAKNTVIEGLNHPFLNAGRYVKLSITDTGIGIPANLLKRIFDPFFTTKQKGHGLGLATCYAIIQKHDGCIEVESVLGNGATFHIFLPASQHGLIQTAAKQSISHKGSGSMLIMDDEPFIREILGGFLKGMGYTILEASDGEEALKIYAEAQKNNKSIVGAFFDLTIPGGMGGGETIIQIRKQDPGMPVYVSSGYSEDPIMANPNAYGFTDSIRKPYRKEDLVTLLNKKHPFTYPA